MAVGGSPFKMVDLARGKESTDSKPGKITSSPYSYEHRITLDQNALGKLGVDTPQVGDKFHVMGHGEVTNVSSHSSEDGSKSTRVELQMKKMGLRKKGGLGGGATQAGAQAAVNQGIQDANDD